MPFDSRARWFRSALKLIGRTAANRGQLRRAATLARRLRVEPLEDRRMLAMFTVSNLNDTGAGSLRAAIDSSNDSLVPDQINFTVTGTINIASQLPRIFGSLSIEGPGAELLTIDAGGGATADPGDGYRIFLIADGLPGMSVITMTGLTLTGGDPSDFAQQGGAIHNSESLSLSDLTITGNYAHQTGGGIFTNGLLNLSNCTISENSARIYGGGIYLAAGMATIFASNLEANLAQRGGGINISDDGATLNLIDSTLSENFAQVFGGGIYNEGGNLIVNTSTLSANTSRNGGAIANAGPASTATITASTLSGNTAFFEGGGLFNERSATSHVRGSTITANAADDGGGIFNDAASSPAGIVNVTSSIVAGNTASPGPNVSGGLNTDEHNAIGGDPRLGPLAENGGPTKTHALLPGSPALNGGPTSTPSLFDYQLFGDYADASGVGDPLASFGGTLVAGVYDYGANQGLDLQVPFTNPNNYSLELRFKLDQLTATSGYQKLIDYNGGFIDAGFYAWNNRLRYLVQNNGVNFYTGGFLSATDWNHVVIVRTPGGVTSYINGALDRTYPNSDGAHDLALFGTIGGGGTDTYLGRLFRGNSSFGPNRGGEVDRIRYYDHPLTAAEVTAAFNIAEATDQRGFARDVGEAFDIGAYEAQVSPTADFDANGDVDGGDFLAWQRGLGTSNATRAQGNSDDDADADHSDLVAWRATFGQVVATPAVVPFAAGAVSHAVPEVTSGSDADLVGAALALPNLTLNIVESEPSRPVEQVLLPVVVKEMPTWSSAFSTAATTENDRARESSQEPTTTDVAWLSEKLLKSIFS